MNKIDVNAVYQSLKDLKVSDLLRLIELLKADGIDIDAGAGTAVAAQAGGEEKQESVTKSFKIQSVAKKLDFIKTYRKFANDGKIADKGKARDSGAEMSLGEAKADADSVPLELEVVDAKDLKDIKEALSASCEVA